MSKLINTVVLIIGVWSSLITIRGDVREKSTKLDKPLVEKHLTIEIDDYVTFNYSYKETDRVNARNEP